MTITVISEGLHLVTGRVTLEGSDDHSGARVTFSGHDPVFTDAEGNFEIQLPTGDYTVSVEKAGFLTATTTLPGLDSGATLTTVVLLGGDANGDGVVDLRDLRILGGDVVNGDKELTDLVIAAKNLGRRESPWV